MIQPVLRNFPNIEFIRFTDEYSITEIEKNLSELGEDSAVIFFTLYRDSSGKYLSVSEGVTRITKASVRPVYTTHFLELPYGVIGGKVLGGRQQGEFAGELAKRILEGEAVGDIPFEKESPTQYVFNYGVLKRWNIKLSQLPEGSIVLDKPFSVYKEYKVFIWMITGFVFFLLVAIGVLQRSLQKSQKIEKKLKAKQDLLNKSEEISHLGSWHLNLQNNILTWSDEQYRIFGKTPDEFTPSYEAFFELVHPEDREMVRRSYESALENNLPYECIHRVVGPNGEVRVVLEKSEDIFSENGVALYSYGFTQDITERVETEERYRKMIEVSIDGFWIVDINGKILDVNNAYCSMIGYSREELLQMSIKDIDDLQSAVDVQDHVKKVIKSGSARFESVHRKKDGEKIVVEISTIYSETSRGLFYVFIRDVTDKKRVEKVLIEEKERFRSHFENVPIPYQSLDYEGCVIDVNPTWLETLGYTREEVIGKSFGEFLPPAMKEHFQYNFPRFKDKGEILGVEFEMVKKDGSVIMTRFSGRISYDQDGSFKQTHCVFQDITEILKAEEERQVLESRLQQAQKMEAVGTLAGGIAHDFNNILAAIIGYGEMALDDAPADSYLKDDLSQILHSANRAKGLVDQILAFSRQSQVERIPTNIRSIIKEGLSMLRSSVPTTIRISEDLDRNCGIVLADPTQVHQILMNLCTNAYHAMEDTVGELSVTLKPFRVGGSDLLASLLEPGEYNELVVTDSGSGIGPDVLDKIFDPYFTTKDSGKGTGLGLAIIQGIITEYGGAITVESQLGEGSAFHVYFPVLSQEALPELSTSEEPVTGKERILFVDDEEMLGKMGKRILENLGYDVTVKNSSKDALQVFTEASDRYDLVITDQTMPDMTGVDLAQRLIAIRPDLPVILCTGYSNLVDEETVKSLGIKGFALKPVTKTTFSKLIREVLDDDNE